MKRFSYRLPLCLFFVLLGLVLLLPSTGCGGKKKAGAKKDYGKPTWLKLDPAKFAKVSEFETTLEDGAVSVYDPEGWERAPRGAAKPPKGFKSVIVFQKGGVTLMMTKSKDSREMPDLDEDNIEEFADGAQQLFKTPVKMVKLGSQVGVYFARKVADAQRLSKFYDRRIIATSINGRLFTYELIGDQGRVDQAALNAMYALISKTKIEGMESSEPEAETKTEEVAAAKPAEPATKPEEAKPAEVAAAPKPEEAKPAEAKPEEPKPAVEVAAVTPQPEAPKAEPKKEAPKAEPKKAEKKPAKKGNTKDILNELDALLN